MEEQRRTFISYSRANKDFALKLAKELKTEGFLVWLDVLDIPPGSRWDVEVEKALEESEIFMIIMTPASTASENVRDEIGYAIDTGKRFLPVMLENCTIPLRLRRFQYVDFTNKGFDDGVESAKELLRGLITQPIIPQQELSADSQAQLARAESDRKGKEETERLAKQKSEEVRIRKTNLDAQRPAAEQDEAARKAREEIEKIMRANEAAEREAVQKVEEERTSGKLRLSKLPIRTWMIYGAVAAIAAIFLIAKIVWGNSSVNNQLSTKIAAESSVTPPVLNYGSVPTPVSMDSTSNNLDPLEDLINAAKAEGELNVIALPHDWANYDEIIETFKSKYGIQVNELNPNAGSLDELEAIEANKESKDSQAPDVIDIGVGHTMNAMNKGLIETYKVTTWDTIEMKDPDGYWWTPYFGVLIFEVNKPAIENIPQDWEDLLKPEYKGKVAMGGDVLKSNQALMTVIASGLSRAGGDKTKAAEMGLQFWKEMHDVGNFIPINANQGTIAQGETPIVIEWDYLALANRDVFSGNPELVIVVPETGVLAGPYAGGISAYAPHPNAARLWWEFVMSDEGQLLYLKGYAHPIRYNDMVKRGVIPPDLAANLPPAEAYANTTFLTVEELQDATTYITQNWQRVVYGE